MAYKGYRKCVTLEASASNLGTRQFHIVELTGTGNECNLAAAAGGYGILENHPENDGEAATVCVFGETKCRAGGAVSIGQHITAANTGYGIAVVSGAAHGSAAGALRILGIARTAAASGYLFTIDLNPTVVAIASGAAFTPNA